MGSAGSRRDNGLKGHGETSANQDILSLAFAVFGEWFLEMAIVGRGRG